MCAAARAVPVRVRTRVAPAARVPAGLSARAARCALCVRGGTGRSLAQGKAQNRIFVFTSSCALASPGTAKLRAREVCGMPRCRSRAPWQSHETWLQMLL